MQFYKQVVNYIAYSRMLWHEAHNLEGPKGAYCRVCGMYNYTFIYLYIGMSGFTVQSAIVYGVNLFAMPGMLEYIQVASKSIFTIPAARDLQGSLKLIEQGVTIFTSLNDLNAEKIPAQR